MVIYGSRSTQIAHKQVISKCNNCDNNNLELFIFQRYAHVFWIPLFPIGKTAVSECGQCKQVLKQKEMPSSLKPIYSTLKSQSKAPLWTFAGLGLLMVLMVASSVNSDELDKRNAQWISAPQRGDVFEIKTEDNYYTLYKVDSVGGDIVFIRRNEYEYDKISGLNKLKAKGESGFTDELIPYEKKELKEMLEKGEIMNINRE